MADRSCVVELTGARGSGKSTFATRLRRELSARHLAPSLPASPRTRLLRKLRSIADEVEALIVFAPWRPRSLRTLRFLVHRYRRTKQQLRRLRAQPGVHVLDEGTWHLILTAYIKTQQRDMGAIVATLRRRLPLPDVVVLLDCSEDVIADRRSARANAGDRKRPGLDAAGRAGLLALRSAIAGVEGPPPNPSYLIVDNGDNQDPAALAARVADLAQAAAVRRGLIGPQLRATEPLPRTARP